MIQIVKAIVTIGSFRVGTKTYTVFSGPHNFVLRMLGRIQRRERPFQEDGG